jgi:hypothetical protein
MILLLAFKEHHNKQRPVKKIFFLFGLCIGSYTYSQEFKDTTFSVRGFSCSCKYNFNIEEDNKIFDRSGKPAYFPGGEDKWKKFVKENLDKGFKGNEKVEVRFKVDKNGDLSEFELMTRSPAQKYQEIVKVLKLSGKWFPSVQDGYCVKSYLRLTFEL